MDILCFLPVSPIACGIVIFLINCYTALGSSSFSFLNTRPTMDPAIQMMHLCQGDQPIEDYVMDYLELAYLTCMDKVDICIYSFGRHFNPNRLTVEKNKRFIIRWQ